MVKHEGAGGVVFGGKEARSQLGLPEGECPFYGLLLARAVACERGVADGRKHRDATPLVVVGEGELAERVAGAVEVGAVCDPGHLPERHGLDVALQQAERAPQPHARVVAHDERARCRQRLGEGVVPLLGHCRARVPRLPGPPPRELLEGAHPPPLRRGEDDGERVAPQA